MKKSKKGKKGKKATKKLTKKLSKKRSLSKKLSRAKTMKNSDEKASLIFKSKDLKSNKYWKIARTGAKTIVKFGRMGHKTRKNEKTHKDVAASKKFFQKMIGEKTKKGYVKYNEDSLTN